MKKTSTQKASQKSELPEQQVMPGVEKTSTAVEEVIDFLKQNNVKYIDKRSSSGALWIIGGKELSDIAKQCRKFGIRFTFKEDGGRATKGKPSWWAK